MCMVGVLEDTHEELLLKAHVPKALFVNEPVRKKWYQRVAENLCETGATI